MARDRRPSGLPRERLGGWDFLRPSTDIEKRLEREHEGFLSARRSLLVATAIVALLVVVLAVTGNGSAAAGLAVLLLVPLLLVLAGAWVAVMVARRNQ